MAFHNGQHCSILLSDISHPRILLSPSFRLRSMASLADLRSYHRHFLPHHRPPPALGPNRGEYLPLLIPPWSYGRLHHHPSYE